MTDNPHADRPNFDPLNVEQLAASIIEENADILANVAEAVSTADDWDKIAKIDNEEDAKDLTDFLNQIGSIEETAEDRRVKRKSPFDSLASTVQRFFMDKALNVLGPRKKTLKAKLKVWVDAETARKAAEARVKAEAARKALEAAQTPEQVKAATKDIKKFSGPVKGGIATDYGSKVHTTSSWGYEVVDVTLVPRQYMAIDNAAVMAFIRTGTVEAPVTIAGLKVVRKSTLAG